MTNHPIHRRPTRRAVLKSLAGGATTALVGSPWSRAAWAAEPAEPLPPVRAITRGPGFHWFAYYDKFQFDASDRYVLGMRVDFEHRLPTPDDPVQIGMVDLQDNDRWIELGTSRAWCWQQGCMLQWRPSHDHDVVFNDREPGRFVTRVLNVKTKQLRTLPAPIYCLTPDGRYGLGCNFSRLWDVRPGYGYPGLVDPEADVPVPARSGMYRVDLETGEVKQLITVAEAMQVGQPLASWNGCKHYFIHLLAGLDNRRFVFLHRWRDSEKQRGTRMMTADLDGSNIRVVDDCGLTSHFIWRDAQHLLAFSGQPAGNRFYLFEDGGSRIDPVGPDVMTADGHCTYLPGNEWILNDTYPDRERLQHPYLYRVADGRRVPLGHFLSPPAYTGEWRTDTHPRSSRNGRMVVIDSTHGGNGRQLYLIDISKIVDARA